MQKHILIGLCTKVCDKPYELGSLGLLFPVLGKGYEYCPACVRLVNQYTVSNSNCGHYGALTVDERTTSSGVLYIPHEDSSRRFDDLTVSWLWWFTIVTISMIALNLYGVFVN